MTLYYLRTGVDPVVLQHRNASWDQDLKSCAQTFPCSSWRSLPKRFARLVLNCTRDAQERRWDLAYIVGELERLAEAERYPTKVLSAQMIAEELAARGFGFEYEWDESTATARYQLSSTSITLVADERMRCIRLEFSWVRVGGEDFQRTKSWLPERQKRIRDRLNANGWSESISIDTGRLFGSAMIQVKDAARHIDSIGQTVAFIKDQLTY